MVTTTALDTALDELGAYHLEYGPGFSDHAPMVVEALDHVGRADAIEPWLARYRRRLDPMAADVNPDETAWIERFDQELAGADWRAVLARWVPRLVDATSTAAGHGLLRTSHAARGLARADTPARRAELARGLAYWAWRARALPRLELGGERSPLDALATLAPLAGGYGGGMISTRLRDVATPAFVDAASGVSLPDDPSDALGEVSAAAAAALAAGPDWGRFALLHGLTSSVAARELLALLPVGDARQLVVGAWTTVAALWAAFGDGASLQAGPRGASRVPSASALIDRAVAHGDEHAIKVAVAAGSEEQATGGDRPDLRRAAEIALGFFGA